MSDVWDEIPYEKREWWVLAYSNEDKQTVLDWHNKYKLDYPYKLINTTRNLKDIFYPRAEIKTRTQTSQMLKALNYAD
jgi:hypothetical protein